jgi:hypothetical protein
VLDSRVITSNRPCELPPRLEDLEQLEVSLTSSVSGGVSGATGALTNVEAEAESQKAADDERLRLSPFTRRRAELCVVFVIMLCDGLFPPPTLEEPEAKKRSDACFSGVTRAKRTLPPPTH